MKTPSCIHFPLCGGCQILTTPYAIQLEQKHRLLKEVFRDFPGVVIPSVLPSPRTEGYRHKVQLPFATKGKADSVMLGCYATGSHKVVDQLECQIQDPALSQVAWAVRDWARREQIPIYRERTGAGYLRHVLLRKGSQSGEILVGLVANGPRPQHYRPLAKSLLAGIEKALRGHKATVVGIVQDVNTRNTNVVLGGELQSWWGRSWIKEQLGPYTFHVELSTFFQVNPYQTPRLYDCAASFVPEGSRVIDAYCGMGTIALWLSSKVREVVGVEENEQAVQAAKRAAEANGVTNAKFVGGDASVILPQLVAGGFDTIIVDPPRKGMEDGALEAVATSGAKRLIYVACQPESLARDAKKLSDRFKLVVIKPIDMFPHTSHLECVACFEAR